MMQVKSSVKHLKPIFAMMQGHEIAPHEIQKLLSKLCAYTTSEAQRIWNSNYAILIPAITATKKRNIPYKQRFIRDSGADSTMTPYPGAMVGNLRELVEYKIISESSSWVKSSNPHKKPFTFNQNLDLSATGNQFSSIQYSSIENQVHLHLRALDQTLDLVFQLPEYVRKRKISKISKPRIRWNGSEHVFDFTLFEDVPESNGKLTAGVDLGKVKPYVAVVASEKGKRIADYQASNGIKSGWEKHYELGRLIGFISGKITRKQALGIDCCNLMEERKRVRAKRERLHMELSKRQANEIARKLSAHSVGEVRVENLGWLSGSKGVKSRGGKWSFSRQQSDLEHSLVRRGIRSKKKSPKDSSQNCWHCGHQLLHKKRSVYCRDCKTTLDRDFNAAMNMATLNHLKTREWLARFYGPSEVDHSFKQVNESSIPKACLEASGANMASMVT